MAEIKFAAIPKTASRTLASLGLSGEVHGKHHSRVTEYPEYERFDWYHVARDEHTWLMSWWLEAGASDDSFSKALGMEFISFADDMRCFANFENIGDYDAGTGFNRWLPKDKEEFKIGMRRHKNFKNYCFYTIMDGVKCKPVEIDKLDEWLIKRGFRPVHKNVKQYHDFGIINEGGM